MNNLDNFKIFNPAKEINSTNPLPDCPGNYIVVLRDGSNLPETDITPVMTEIEHDGAKYRVIYTGISTSSLMKRDYRQHFGSKEGNGNAGRSTLRKSLGSLFGFTQIPRDAKNPQNGKTKFNESDEAKLSEWMRNNLLLLYKTSNVKEKIKQLENELIDTLNPPLNLQENENPINEGFRNLLSSLRNRK